METIIAGTLICTDEPVPAPALILSRELRRIAPGAVAAGLLDQAERLCADWGEAAWIPGMPSDQRAELIRRIQKRADTLTIEVVSQLNRVAPDGFGVIRWTDHTWRWVTVPEISVPTDIYCHNCARYCSSDTLGTLYELVLHTTCQTIVSGLVRMLLEPYKPNVSHKSSPVEHRGIYRCANRHTTYFADQKTTPIRSGACPVCREPLTLVYREVGV